MFDGKTELINEFDHNYIELVNGSLKSCNMKFEEKSKIKVDSLKSPQITRDYSNKNLYCLNKALSEEDLI